MIRLIKNSVCRLVIASEGNPLMALLVIALFVIGINTLEVVIENLIWGNRFEHWLDIVILICAIAYGAYTVEVCAIYNANIKRKDG